MYFSNITQAVTVWQRDLEARRQEAGAFVPKKAYDEEQAELGTLVSTSTFVLTAAITNPHKRGRGQGGLKE